jgi:ubiquitin C-terminal hydrolase
MLYLFVTILALFLKCREFLLIRLDLIHITFNGNESRFNVEGYNASDNQRIIAQQGLVIAK